MTIMRPACNEVIHPLADFTCQSTWQQQENRSLPLYDWSIALRSRPLAQSLRFVNETSWRWREFYIYCALGRREIELYLPKFNLITFFFCNCSFGECQVKSVKMDDFGVYAIFGVDEPPQQILR